MRNRVNSGNCFLFSRQSVVTFVKQNREIFSLKMVLLVETVVVLLFFTVSGKEIVFEECVNSALRLLKNTNGNLTHVLYYEEPTDGKFLTSVLRQINQTVMLTDKMLKFFNEFHRIVPSAYVIVTSSLNNLQQLFDRIDVTHSNWYPRSRFVVIFTKMADERITAEYIVLILRKYDINDVLILINGNNSMTAFTWFPFSVRNRCRDGVHVTLLDKCTDRKSIFTKNLYPRKIPWKFYGCVFTMSGFHWPPYVYVSKKGDNFTAGYNILQMRLMTEKHNLTLKHVMPDPSTRWGSKLDNGTWTGGLGMLQSLKADVSMGGSLETMMRINTFDFSTTYNSIYMKFYLVLPSKLPHWKNMIDIFSLEFWAIIVVVYVFTSFILGFVAKLSWKVEKMYYRKFSNCFITMWGIAFGNSASCIPNSHAVRIVFLLWLIYNFHITLVYSSSLLSFITKPAYEDPIKTLEELSKSNLKIIMVKQFVQISSKMDQDFRNILVSKAHPHMDHVETIEEMLRRRDLVVLDTADHFEIFAKDKLNRVYSLDDFVRLNPCLYLKKGSIFLQYVNDIQLRTYENGMLQKLEKDYRGLKKYQKPAYDNEVLPLTLPELSGSFYVLLFGLILSILVFWAETTFRKIKK